MTKVTNRTVETLVVDDERLARQKVRTLLHHHPDFHIVKECANGEEALQLLASRPVDVLFLDVQMPGMDGFGVLGRIEPERMPHVIFTTAHDEYAVKAFDVHAVDYLLKPFDRKRFDVALGRVRQRIDQGERSVIDQRFMDAIQLLTRGESWSDRVMIRGEGRIFFLKVDEIDWIEAADNYVRIHVRRESHLLRETMSALEAQLSPKRFVRIHRSAIVNVDRIREIKTLFHGEQVVVLHDGKEIALGKTYRERIRSIGG